MNSFNNIQKFKYTKNQADCVALREYIIFTDDRIKEKYVVLKLINNLNQRLYDIKVEISQYDINNELIEKSIVAYNTKVEAHDEFVPKAKLKVSYACQSISFKVVYARFERVKFENQQFIEIPHRFVDHHATLPPVKQAPIIIKKEDVSKKKTSFRAREFYKKNIAKFPKVWNVFVSIICIIFMVVSVIYFRMQSNVFTISNIDFRIINDKEVSLVSYDGMESTFTVPSSVGERKVTRIESRAFKNSIVEKVNIGNEKMSIQDEAFYNCDKLTEVNIYSKASVGYYIFTDCDALENVYMPNVKLKPYTFSGTTHLERLTVGSLSLSTLYEAFINTKDNDVVINRFEIKDVELLEKEFFEKAVINNLIIPETCRVGYGVYKYLNPYNYYDNGTIESIDGEVVSINAKEGKLTLDGYFNKINTTKFANELGGIKELKIVGYNELVNNYELFNALKSVEVLEVDNFDVLNTDILSACRSINTLRCPVPYDRLEYYIGSYSNISNLEIYGQGHLSQYCTENLRYISSVKVSNEVSGMDEHLFPQSYNIHTIDIPLVNAYAPLPHVYPMFANAINVTISAKEAHIPDKYFTEMYNVSTIKVGEGIMSVGYNIVSDAPNLTSIELPDTATDMPSMPVIGANCFNLRKVEYALDSRYSTTYAEFNESYEFTRKLGVKNADFITSQFFNKVNVSNIDSLMLKASHFSNIKGEALLKEFSNLQYLYIKADSLEGYLSSFFCGEGSLEENAHIPTYLSTLIIETNELPESYLEGVSNCGNLGLLGVKEVHKNAIKYMTGLSTIYIPETCELSKDLRNQLSDLQGVKIIFEKDNVEFEGNYEDGVSLTEDLKDF